MVSSLDSAENTRGNFFLTTLYLRKQRVWHEKRSLVRFTEATNFIPESWEHASVWPPMKKKVMRDAKSIIVLFYILSLFAPKSLFSSIDVSFHVVNGLSFRMSIRTCLSWYIHTQIERALAGFFFLFFFRFGLFVWCGWFNVISIFVPIKSLLRERMDL